MRVDFHGLGDSVTLCLCVFDSTRTRHTHTYTLWQTLDIALEKRANPKHALESQPDKLKSKSNEKAMLRLAHPGPFKMSRKT